MLIEWPGIPFVMFGRLSGSPCAQRHRPEYCLYVYVGHRLRNGRFALIFLSNLVYYLLVVVYLQCHLYLGLLAYPKRHYSELLR